MKVKKKGAAVKIAASIIAIALIGAALAFAAPFKSELMGTLPDFPAVFAKMFRKNVEIASLAQLQAMHDKMSEKQKAALANYFTLAKWKEVLKTVDEPKKDYLLAEYEKLAGKAKPCDFKKRFPEVLATTVIVLSNEQNIKVLDVLSDKEMAALGFYLDNSGLKTFFTMAPLEKHEMMLNKAPDWMLLEMGLRYYKTVKNYKCKFIKQERVKGKLQDNEIIILKYREKPNAIYMKWIDGAFKGREVIYNEKISTKNIRVREAGALGVVAVSVPLESAVAKRGTNHLITEVGLKYLLNMIRTDWTKSHNIPGDLTRKNFGIKKVDGHNVYVMDSIMKKNPKMGYYCGRLRHYIDYTRSIEIKAEVFDWNNQLMEKYIYLDIKLNTNLKDIDFDPKNPDYNL